MAEVLFPQGSATLEWLEGVETLLDLIPDIFFFAKDRSGRFIAVNRGFADERGGKTLKSDMIGATDYDFWPQHLSEKYVQGDRYVMATGKSLVNVVELAVKPDQSTEWLTTTKVPLFDRHSRIVGMAGYCRTLRNVGGDGPLVYMGDVFDYVFRNYKSALDIGELASLTYLSISQFERQFKRLFHVTPMQYVARVRINAACKELVRNKTCISEIAFQSGFYDPSHFNRQFRRIMGMTPGDFRMRFSNRSDYPRVPGLQMDVALQHAG